MSGNNLPFCGAFASVDCAKLRDVVEAQAVERMASTLTRQNVQSVMKVASETGDHIYWLAGLVAVHNMHIMGDI